MKKLLSCTLLLAGSLSAAAQTSPAEIAACPERAAGIYHSYEYLPGTATPVPEGYVPFYISHYGRHGSRYHLSESAYTAPTAVLREAADKGLLTDKGTEILKKAEILAEDARLRYGDLSPRGAREHRGIAERMFAAYPEVFSTDGDRTCLIDSKSTLVPRCILSMAAFNERLKELNPQITITRESSNRYRYYMSNDYDMQGNGRFASDTADSLCNIRLCPDRILQQLFTAPQSIEQPQKFVRQLFTLAAIAQDASHTGAAFLDIFTDEELYALWECENARRYLQMGPSARLGDPNIASAGPLLRNIVETAERVIAGEEPLSASLRFGHDSYIIPLLGLLGVEGASARVACTDEIAKSWSIEKVSPMGANIQFIFFRNPATEEIRVLVRHNEHEARLPLEGGPYYPWEALKNYCKTLYEK